MVFFVFHLIEVLIIRRGTFCWKPHLNWTSGSKIMCIVYLPYGLLYLNFKLKIKHIVHFILIYHSVLLDHHKSSNWQPLTPQVNAICINFSYWTYQVHQGIVCELLLNYCFLFCFSFIPGKSLKTDSQQSLESVGIRNGAKVMLIGKKVIDLFILNISM